MSNTIMKKKFVLPAHVVAVAVVPLVTEAYEAIKPRYIAWKSDRQIRRMVRDWEAFLAMTEEQRSVYRAKR